MCNYINWHTDEHGYVIQCEACRTFQVSFGTTMLTIDDTEFKRFVAVVTRKKEELVPAYEKDTKCLVIPTPCNKIHCILSERELDQLYSMLQKADTEMRSVQLLRLFDVT